MVLNESLFEDLQVFNSQEVTPEMLEKIITHQKANASQEDNGVAAMLNMAIQDELVTIDQYNSLLVSLPDGYDNIKKIISSIVGEENVHVGELQVALEMVDPQARLRMQGEAEAQLNLNDNKMILN